MHSEQKNILCIHDISCVGRCSLAVITPVLAAMGYHTVQLPTLLLSSHTGGLGAPAKVDCAAYGAAALQQYAALGLQFDAIYVGYLGGAAGAQLAEAAFAQWPDAFKVVDPVLGDHGRLYAGVDEAWQCAVRTLCGKADLILPNATEARLLLGLPQPEAEEELTAAEAEALAEQAAVLAPSVVVTGLPMGKYIGCAGGGQQRFLVRRLRLPRSYPGTGDLFGAVMLGCLLRGNAAEPAVDAAAEFVSTSIQNTPPEADPRFGVWFEPQLNRLLPPRY